MFLCLFGFYLPTQVPKVPLLSYGCRYYLVQLAAYLVRIPTGYPPYFRWVVCGGSSAPTHHRLPNLSLEAHCPLRRDPPQHGACLSLNYPNCEPRYLSYRLSPKNPFGTVDSALGVLIDAHITLRLQR